MALFSGYFPTPAGGQLTPSGYGKKVAFDNPYLTKDEYVATPEATGLGITSSSQIYTSGQLDRVILRASAQINRLCGRYFDTQTIDETTTGFTVRPYNPELVTSIVSNPPLTSVNNMWIQVLQWFISIDVAVENSYLQVFPDTGFLKIVPLLNSAGSGTGSPIPAEILDRVPLGVLWVNYTFGFGMPQKAWPLTLVTGQTNQFQADIDNRLWAPDQQITIYNNSTSIGTSSWDLTTQKQAVTGGLTFDYTNGIVTIPNYTSGTITADFTTNQTLPFDIKEACILLVSDIIGRAQQNPLGATSYNILSYNISFGDSVINRVKELLAPYNAATITII